VHQEATRLLILSIFIILSTQAPPLPKLLLLPFLVLISSYKNIPANMGAPSLVWRIARGKSFSLTNHTGLLSSSLETDAVPHG